MTQVEFLYLLLGLLVGIIGAIPIGYALFQTKSGCKAIHAKAAGNEGLVLAELASLKTSFTEWTAKADESRRIQFNMIRAIVSLDEKLSPADRKEILNMQG